MEKTFSIGSIVVCNHPGRREGAVPGIPGLEVGVSYEVVGVNDGLLTVRDPRTQEVLSHKYSFRLFDSF